MKIRFLIEVRIERECEECVGTEKRHTINSSAWTLPDGTPAGDSQVGDVYFTPCSGHCSWDNCDGQHLICLCPGTKDWPHPWQIDGRASNCMMPDERTHRCWVRHGDPRVPGELHVDKAGHTCAAGAGSIQIPGGWHGHLHHGELV